MFQKRMLSLAVSLVACGSLPAFSQDQASSQEDKPLEEIVVQGVRAAELNAREIERNKDIFSSVISQDDAGNFADQNVAEALQRLPGVTLQKNDGQGEFVNVRGLGPSFVGVSLNNSELASSSTDNRSVALNSIPADLMGSIEVFKSLTPDMDLNSIGGRVNVNSVTAFSRGEDSVRLSLQGAMHEQRGEFSPKATLQATKLLADETIGIAVSLSHEERATEVNQIFHSTSNDLRFLRVSQPQLGDDSNNRENNARSSLEYLQEGVVDPYIDEPRILAPWEFEVRQDESVRTTTAGTFNLEWRPTDNSEYFVRYDHSTFTDEELTLREYFRFGQGDARYVSYVNPENNSFAVSDTDLQQHVFIQEAEDQTTTFALGGENNIDLWTVDYEFHNSVGEQTNPDDRRVQFRIQSLPMYARSFQDDIEAQVLSRTQIRALAEQSGAVIPTSGVPGTGGYAGFPGYELDERRQEAFVYDGIYLEDGFREDEVEQYKLNVRRDFEGGFINYFKAGILAKERTRSRDRARWSVNPSDYPFACEGDEECLTWANTGIGRGDFETYTPRNPRFDHDFITTADAENLLDITRQIPLNLDPNRSGHASKSDNYSIYEESNEAYLMGEFNLMDNMWLIAGARYVETEFGSTGWFTLRHDRFQREDGVVRDIVMPLGDPATGGFVVNEYDGVYPGLHLRWEPTDDLLVRSSLWTNYNRPDYDDASADAGFDGRVFMSAADPIEGRDNCSDNLQDDLGAPNDGYVEFISQNFTLCEGNALELGNTDLKAMEATNFDASVSWYGPNGHFAELAVFYKQIDDFIVEVRGIDVSRNDLPGSVRVALDRIDSSDGGEPSITENVFRIEEDYVFQDVNTTLNGDTSSVYGAEISYSRYFENNFFVNGNMTLLSSTADAGETVRADDIRLPNQADLTANLTLGWENEMFSARLIQNYRGEVLKQIGSCSAADIQTDREWAALNDASNPDALEGAAGSGVVYPENCRRWADVFHDEIFGLDFKATYNLNEDIKFYFDVLNVTEDVDVFYFRGNDYSNGPVMYKSEGLGRTFQVGATIRFW
ncbi:TonB-dependent receptor [Marinimicrobium agarilyticum]|uniref:TonB-dependent receptor n=1 Tax=Marinimicrobium agarilyticum TaxID=306546 RepID=UPI00040A3DDA|nr:TonB-dependent receptor [Marinimicrobium agarilyticum]